MFTLRNGFSSLNSLYWCVYSQGCLKFAKLPSSKTKMVKNHQIVAGHTWECFVSLRNGLKFKSIRIVVEKVFNFKLSSYSSWVSFIHTPPNISFNFFPVMFFYLNIRIPFLNIHSLILNFVIWNGINKLEISCCS